MRTFCILAHMTEKEAKAYLRDHIVFMPRHLKQCREGDRVGSSPAEIEVTMSRWLLIAAAMMVIFLLALAVSKGKTTAKQRQSRSSCGRRSAFRTRSFRGTVQ